MLFILELPVLQCTGVEHAKTKGTKIVRCIPTPLSGTHGRIVLMLGLAHVQERCKQV